MVIQNIKLPDGITSIEGGPQFSSTVLESEGGFEQANINWPHPLWEYTVSYVRDHWGGGFDEIYTFFLNRKGRGYGFLVKDWADYTSAHGGATGHVELIGGVYRLTKRYPDGLGSYTRLITRPKSGTIALAGGAAGGTINYTTGIVTGIASAGTWTGEFEVPCRFKEDNLKYDMEPSGVVRLQVGLRELRV